MARSVPAFLTPGPDTVLGRWLGRQIRHPDEFVCAVRVLDGQLDGEGRRWSYRRSAVDPLPVSSDVRLRHGDTLLVLRVGDGPVPATGLRPRHVAWPAVEAGSGAQVQVGGDVELAVVLGLDN